VQNLAAILRDRADAPEAELSRASDVATRTGLGLAHVVVRSGLIDARRLVGLLAEATGLRVFDPAADRPLPAAVRRLPHKLAMRRRALVIRSRPEGGWLVAFSDPTDRVSRGAVQNLLGGKVEAILIDEITLEQGIQHFYGDGDEQETAAADLRPQETEVHLPEMNLDDAPSFLTENTDEAMRTYAEPMARKGAGADDADLAWLRARAAGEMEVASSAPPLGEDLSSGDASAFDEPQPIDVVMGVIDATRLSPPPQMTPPPPPGESGLIPQAPRPATLVDALSGHTEEMSRQSFFGQVSDEGEGPTMVDENEPLHDDDGPGSGERP
jgi:hypothetical protein